MAGLFFEECTEGLIIEHALRRTVTEADNIFFCSLTFNTQPLHIDEEYSKGTEYGQRLVNSVFTLGLVCGMAVTDTTLGTALGNLGFEEVKFPNPVFHGDTIRATTEISGRRESKSRPNAGIVSFTHHGYNQRGELVCEAKRASLMRKK